MSMRVHFIGCGGVSMKRLREITEKLGHETSGSDLTNGGHRAENVKGSDMAVYTSAVPIGNEELVYARANGIPVVERAEYLGAIAASFEKTIAVAGTHGKTTTTGMLKEIFASRYPCVHIGGELKDKPDIEKSEYFITEACEYKRSFLWLNPHIGIVLNAELDHTDYYKDLFSVRTAFGEFAQKCRTVLYNGDDEGLRKAIKSEHALSFGFSERNDFRAVAAAADKDSVWSFNVSASGLNLGRITLAVKGRHNVYNALAAASAALTEGLALSEIEEGLKAFTGVKRRMEYLGEVKGAAVYTDYAHHPTEIRALIQSLKSDKRLIMVFEPHTYSRTLDLFDEFVKCFDGADEVIFAPVYGARETGGKADSSDLTNEVNKRLPAKYLRTYDEINGYLTSILRKGDTVVFTGAGTINLAGEKLVSASKG